MPEPVYETSKPVLVTGATGYVAGWIVKSLLEKGFTVHAAVRDPDDADKRAHLDAIDAAAPGTIRYFKADLLDAGSYDEAAEGCAVIFHTASPFATVVKDPRRDLVEPAVEGTKNVLGAADRTDSVERVVLTSSCAAIYGDNRDIAKAPGKTLTEEVWNTSSNLSHQAYSYSKTQAEAAAWEVAGAQGRWRLVAVNPALVLGPGVKPQATSESFTLIRQLGNGTMKTGAPPLEFGVVDVRDVAEAHLRAAFIPAAEGRHIVCAETMSLLDMARALRAEFGDDWPFPKSELPKWLVWLTGPMINKALTRKFISRNLGWPFRADNAKSREALGLEYRPAAQAIVDMFAQMVEAGLVKKR